MREALNQAMREEMRRDESVFLMGEEVAAYQGAYKVSKGLLDEFGDRRVIDTPITELGFAGLGVGAAMTGLRPIIEFMTFNFSILATDQIINSAAKMRYMSGGQFKIPIVFRGPNGSAFQVSSQHSQALESWYAHFPGLKVVMPSTPADAKGLLIASIRDPDPVIFLEPKRVYRAAKGEVPEGDYTVPLGVAATVRSGTDVTVLAYGAMLYEAVDAANKAAAQGVDAEVIDLRTLWPVDIDAILESVKKTGRLVVVHEAPRTCGLGGELTSLVTERVFYHLQAPPIRVTGFDTPFPYALEMDYLPLSNRILPALLKVARAG
jgi:pyruvate/2-oxoglutarate/acetoin dehydrogenase E1 component